MRHLLALTLFTAVAGATLLAAPDTLACGAFFRSASDANLAIDAQRALLVWRGLEVDMHLQLAADSDGSAFAWIIPVPGVPTLALGDAAVFAALDEVSTPNVEIIEESGGGGGGFCAGDASDGSKGGGLNQGGGVVHFGGGRLGDYQWDLIGGSDAEAITGWLGDNGYVTPEGLSAVVAPYTAMRFLAVKLVPSATAGAALDIQPLVVTTARPGNQQLTFPLGFSRLSAIDITPVVLYVIADKRYRVSNAASTEVDFVGAEMKRQFDRGEEIDYEAAVDTLTADAGGRLVVTEYARDLRKSGDLPAALSGLLAEDAYYLTRLYARVPLASLDDLVITFAHEADEVEPEVIISDAGSARPTSFALALVGLLIGVSVIRRREG